MESLTDQAEAVQSLNHLQGFVAVQQELADSLPSFSNESDRFNDLQIFLCGSNGSSSGLTDLFDRLTRGNDYQQGGNEQMPCGEVVTLRSGRSLCALRVMCMNTERG